MVNMWNIHLDLINIEEEIDRLVLRRNAERFKGLMSDSFNS